MQQDTRCLVQHVVAWQQLTKLTARLPAQSFPRLKLLARLEFLWLGCSDKKKQQPLDCKWIQPLTRLRWLRLDCAAVQLAKLPGQLESLSISQANPGELTRFPPTLRFLRLECAPRDAVFLEHLEEADLDSRDFSPYLNPNFHLYAPALRSLRCFGITQFSAPNLSHLAVTHLLLGDSRLPTTLAGLVHLQRLDVPTYSPELAAAIGAQPSITHLRILPARFPMDSRGISTLAALGQIRTLEIADFTDRHMAPLLEMSNLEALVLEHDGLFEPVSPTLRECAKLLDRSPRLFAKELGDSALTKGQRLKRLRQLVVPTSPPGSPMQLHQWERKSYP